MTEQLQEMKARAEKVSGFCVDYMRQGIRHLQRNCDVECPTHEGDWELCKQPDRYDGDTMAQVLTENAKLIAALEAVEEWAEKRANELRDYASTLNRDSTAEIRHSAYADQATATARSIQNLITEALA